MKTMLHKSFKPAKCKTALKLAVSRIKLMKNKKEVQLRQLKRDVAQLLQSGQQQTAMIRVEHVIREEKMMAAFDLIEIYSELVVARLPMIESQKNCPIDLKEAITSIIFASPRCADIPELRDARKHFTAKYGKEFAAAAIELRPDCGVNRNLVEKLSAKAPDVNTKVKVLTAIATEHNVDWEPPSLEEKEPEPPAYMQHVRNNEKASTTHMEPLSHQAASQIEKNTQIPPQFQDTARAETGPSKTYFSADNSGIQAPTAGCEAEVTGLPPSSKRVEDLSYPARQNWNMEFKDATAAAQAAAESAERASMAARAAAQLSSRDKITNQNSSGLAGFSGSGRNGDERVQGGGYALHDELSNTRGKPSDENSFGESSSLQVKQAGARHQDKITESSTGEVGSRKEHSEVSSRKEHSEMEEPYNIGGRVDDERSRANVRGSGDEFERPSSPYHLESEDESAENSFYEEPIEVSHVHGSADAHSDASIEEHDTFSNFHGPTFDENPDHALQENVYKWDLEDREPTSHSSFGYGVFQDKDTSPSAAFYREENHVTSDPWKFRVDSSFAPSGFVEHETMHAEKEAETNVNTGVVFDDSASEDDDLGIPLDQEHKVHASSSSSTPPNRKWTTQLSPGRSGSFEDQHGSETRDTFNRSSTDSGLVDPKPASCYDSDGPASDNEEAYKFQSQKTDTWTLSPDRGESSPAAPRKTQDRTRFSFMESLYSEVGDLPASQQSPTDILEKHSSDYEHRSVYQPPLRSSANASLQSPQPMNIYEDENGSDEVSTVLSLGALTGGLRNKGYKLPPYRVGQSTDSSTSGRETDASVGAILQSASSARKQFNLNKGAGVEKSRTDYFGTDSDSTKVKLAHKGSGDTSEAYNITTDAGMDEKSRRRAPVGYFDSGDSSSEEDFSKKPVVTKGRLGVGIYSSTSGRDSSSGSYESSPAAVPESKPSSFRPQVTAALPVRQTTTVSDGLSGSPQVPRRTKEVKHREEPSSRKTLQDETFVPSVKEKQRTNTEDMKSGGGDSEIPSVLTPSLIAPSRQDSGEKATHVHPKLPDYDALAAHLQSLLTNHR
ncbi:IST1-like protein [Drosera capensis]